MRLNAVYRGAADPFEGERELVLRALPADARVLAARAVVAPAEPADGEPFVEEIAFTDGTGDWGATKLVGTDTFPWVEVDFHGRRTLAGVEGSGNGAALQVDLGGAYVGVASDGTFLPWPGPYVVDLSATGAQPLPALAVARFRLVSTDDTELDVASVTVRSCPTNVTLALGSGGPFWVRLGELTEPETSADFAAVLEAYLTGAAVADGVYLLPFTLRSDSIARLDVSLEIAFLREERLLPEGLDDVLLPFDHSSLAQAAGDAVALALPRTARVIAGRTGGRVSGVFEPSRVAVGDIGPVAPATLVPVTPGRSQAQPLALADETVATALDVLLGGGPATVSATLLPDSDGKPFGDPLWPRPATVQLEQEAAAPVWASVPLPADFQFVSGVRYWLVLSAVEGSAAWAAREAAPGSPGLQSSLDGGLSWRPTSDPALAGALEAHFRLRTVPAGFRMPVELHAGTQRLGFERFEPLGRVDFALNFDEVAATLNDALAESAAPCPETEHLANPELDRWYRVSSDVLLPEEWELTAGRIRPILERRAAVLGDVETNQTSGLSQVVPVQAGCRYAFECLAVARDEGAVAEVIWLAGDCSELRTDRVAIAPLEDTEPQLSVAQTDLPLFLHSHRLSMDPPAGAGQAEVRFLTPGRIPVLIDRASLAVTTRVSANPDLREPADGAIAGWELAAETPAPSGGDVELQPLQRGVQIRNETGGLVALVQRVAVPAGAAYTLELDGSALERPADDGPPAALELRFATGAAPSEDGAVSLPFATGFDRALAEGAVLAGATEAELRLVVPDQWTIALERAALRLPDRAEIPLAFVAQAPGELTVIDARVAYDLAEPGAPSVAEGLCTPTPPGQKPGEHLDPCAYCPCCGEETHFHEEGPARTRAGRPAVVGRCGKCGTKLVHLGGRLVEKAAVVPVEEQVARIALVRAQAPAAGRPGVLTDIYGIGAERARRLEAVGITSLEELAFAQPAAVARELTGVSEQVAAEFIEDARRLSAAGEAVFAPEPERPPPVALRDVHGVGAARARLLTLAGIESVALLAAATPAEVAAKTGLSESVAGEIVSDARFLLARERPPSSPAAPQ